jgi:hypothetical protein
MDLDLPKEAGHKGRGSMTDRGRWPTGWRGAVQLLVGVFIGATLITPAVAHVGGTLNHLWGAPNHIRDKVRAFGDPRWINATEAAGGDLSGTYGDLQISPDTVGHNEIAHGEVFSDDIGDGSIFWQDIFDGGVRTEDIAINTIVADDIAPDAVGSSELHLVTGNPNTSLTLPGGSEGNGDAHTDQVLVGCVVEIIGVSVDWTPDPAADDELYIIESKRLSATLWRVWAGNDTDTDHTFTVTPLCLG